MPFYEGSALAPTARSRSLRAATLQNERSQPGIKKPRLVSRLCRVAKPARLVRHSSKSDGGSAGSTLRLNRGGSFSGGSFATTGLLLRLELGHRGLAAETDLAGALVDADALDRDAVANLDDVLGAAHAEVGQFGDVHQAFLARHALDERTELLGAGDATGVDLANLDLGTAAAEGVDFLHGAVHRVGIVRVDEDLARIVVGDVDLRAGRLDNAADRLAARPDEQADLLGIDLDRLDAGSVLAEVLAGRREGAEHDLEDFHAGLAALVNGGLGDLERETVDLQVELEAGDALGGAGDLEVHVTEMILFTENVGDGGPLLDGAAGIHLGHETAGNTGNR